MLIAGLYLIIWLEVALQADEIEICLRIVFGWWCPTTDFSFDGGTDATDFVLSNVHAHINHGGTYAPLYRKKLLEIAVCGLL